VKARSAPPYAVVPVTRRPGARDAEEAEETEAIEEIEET
jgi:hypothetical protein